MNCFFLCHKNTDFLAVLQIIRLFIVVDAHKSVEMITLFKKNTFFLY